MGATTITEKPGAAPAAKAGTAFLDSVQDDLTAVERLLQEEIRSDVRAAYAISGHTLSAGGKRLRPALVVLAARAVQNAFPTRTIHASAGAAELIHMASLIHDDVVDNAEERRGRPTASAAFGNQISVLVGDYLLAKSIYLAAREGNMDVIRVFSKVTVGLSEGRGPADHGEGRRGHVGGDLLPDHRQEDGGVHRRLLRDRRDAGRAGRPPRWRR